MDQQTAKPRTSAAERNRYFYRTLPSERSIRLLELHAGSRCDFINCSLITVNNLEDAPSYEALSYCWGTESDTEELRCNGEPMPFTVTRNLHVALSRLRLEHSHRLLWIDAMCINQDDFSERGQQVSIMRLIYGRANKVCVWLGITDDSFATTVDLIKYIARSCTDQFGVNNYEHSREILPGGKEKARTGDATKPIPDFDVPDPTNGCWEYLAKFFDLPWFFRVWVIQEVQSCPEVQVLCGEDIMDWSVLGQAAAWFRASTVGRQRLGGLRRQSGNEGTYFGTSQVHFMNLRPLTTHQEAPFLRLLDRAQSFQSSEPRDKIYALLTLPARRCARAVPHASCEEHIVQYHQDQDNNSIARHLDVGVDYQLSVVDLLRQVTLRSIEQYESLETLNYAWKVRRELFSAGDHLGTDPSPVNPQDYPSWVPQWDAVINNRRPHFRAYLYNASLGLRPVIRHGATPESLFLRGIFIDTIKETNVPLGTGHTFDDQTFFATDKWNSSESHIMALSKILAQDHKFHVVGEPQDVDDLHERASNSAQEHFANFAAYICSTVKDLNDDAFISPYHVSCHVCVNTITDIGRTYKHLPTSYNCQLCHMGAFDICSECYSSGRHCLKPDHTIKIRNLQGFWWRYNQDTAKLLSDFAPSGVAREFAIAVTSAFNRRSVFSTVKGLTGMCPLLAQPGDIVVVLFGGRTPYVLRKMDGHYRLVSDCYVYRLMDGEAINLLQEGLLSTQDFHLK